MHRAYERLYGECWRELSRARDCAHPLLAKDAAPEKARAAGKLQVHRQVCLFHRRRGCGESGKHWVCCQDWDGSALGGVVMARAGRARATGKLQVHRQVCLFHVRRGCFESGKHWVCCQDWDSSSRDQLKFGPAQTWESKLHAMRARGVQRQGPACGGCGGALDRVAGECYVARGGCFCIEIDSRGSNGGRTAIDGAR